MKKIYLIFAAMTSVTLFSCTGDEFVGNNNPTVDEATPEAITFAGGSSAITRADLYGTDAATRLGDKFVVYGIKYATAEDKDDSKNQVVFNNFQVEWTANTAGKTESNTADWDYVGKQSYNATPTSQGIKYWDYSTVGHTFYAFSSSDISFPAASTDKISVTKVTSDATSLYNKGYAVTVKTGASLSNLFFSDRVPVAKANYDKTVTFTFRNIGTLVRFGFYETIPGYTVKIDNFYIDADADPDATPTPTAPVTSFRAMNNAKNDGFYASLQNVKGSVDQTMNVTYYDATDAITENRPKLTNPTNGYDYSLKLGDGTSLINTELSTTASAPTWTDGTTGAYTSVYPFEGNTTPLLLKLDFTMTADDGSNDVIHVRGARAVVPAEYVKWKSNFAYTYIFKISDKTNGTTGNVDSDDEPTDPEGMKPITFDAITVDITQERQQTITSVSTNSITTYAEGAIVNEYTASSPIYVTVSNTATGAVITPEGIGSGDKQAQIYRLNKAATEAEVLAQKTGSPMGITFDSKTSTIETTVPLADGTTPSIANVKFTPSSAGTYAYIYTTTAYVAPTYEVQTSGTYDSSNTYYMLSGSGAYFAVPVTTEASFDANKTKLYLQTAPGTPGVYDVKVIKVQ